MKKILVLLLLVLVSQCEKALSTDSHDTNQQSQILLGDSRFLQNDIGSQKQTSLTYEVQKPWKPLPRSPTIDPQQISQPILPAKIQNSLQPALVEVKKKEPSPKKSAKPTKTIKKTPEVPQVLQQATSKQFLHEVNTPILGKSLKINGGMSFQRIQIGNITKKYLFFNLKLRQNDKWQNATMAVLSQKTQKTLITCPYSQLDWCYLSQDKLHQDSVLYVVVKCNQDCQYSLSAQWDDLERLLPDKPSVFMFSQNLSQLYYVQLDKQGEFQEMRINLAPRVTRKPFDNIKIYGKFGQQSNPTPEDYDFASVNLWQDGQGVFLSKQQIKNKQMIILLVGQSETTYRLELKLVRNKTHQIETGDCIYEYIRANQFKSYYINFENKESFDEFSLSYSSHSGAVKVGYFFDKEMKRPLEIQPLQYMQDSQYVFTAKQVQQFAKQNISGIYGKVIADQRDATFGLKFTGRKNQQSVQLKEHVYSFLPIVGSKFVHFNFKRWAQETQHNSNLKFSVTKITVVGKVKPTFFVCQGTLAQCTGPQTYKKFTSQIPILGETKLGQKKLYDLQIKNTQLHKINMAEEEVNIVVKIDNVNATQKQKGYSVIALEFINNNKVLYLRQGRPVEGRLAQNQAKMYKYINSDPHVKEIRVHLVSISGNPIIKGTSGLGVIEAEANTIHFTRNLTLPIAIIVSSQSRAIYSLSMQIIHISQKTQSENVITISEDLAYTVQIQPNHYTIFEVVPIYYDFYFKYTASQSVIACVVDINTNRCRDFLKLQEKLKQKDLNQSVFIPVMKDHDVFTQAELQDRKARVKITNPFSNSIAQVDIIFHSRDVGQCERKKIGKVYNQVAKDKTCFSYLIPEDNEQSVLLYISKREFARMGYSVLLCGNRFDLMDGLTTLKLSPEVIAKNCNRTKDPAVISIVWSVNTKHKQSTVNDVMVNVLVQFEGGITYLPQGVSYSVSKMVSNSLVGKFAFDIINPIKTKIVLSPIKGQIRALAKIVKSTLKEKTQLSDIDYDFQSQYTQDYSQNPTIIISQEAIKQGCKGSCSILIVVYTNIVQIGHQVDFQIQVIQRFELLNDDTTLAGYLEQGSSAYYQYYAKDQTSTLLFLISDHNHHCVRVYLGALEYPGPQNNLVNSPNGNELIFQHNGGPRRYYITVTAKKTCDYTISGLTLDSSIHRLQAGKQNILKMRKGSVQYFSFEHLSKQGFRILSVIKYGDVKLYLNKSESRIDHKSYTKQELSLDNFKFKNSFSNTLNVDSRHKMFCSNCDYLLAVEALQNTEATLYLAYSQTIITLYPKRYLHDHLENIYDYTLVKYKGFQKIKLALDLHQGAVKVSAFYKDQTISQDFTNDYWRRQMEIDFLEEATPKFDQNKQKIDPYLIQMMAQAEKARQEEKQPINIIIKAIERDTVYSLSVVALDSVKDLEALSHYQQITSGTSSHVNISSVRPLCLNGYLRDVQDKIMISTSQGNRELLKSIVVQAKLGTNKKIKAKSEITKSLLSISFDQKFTLGKVSEKYQICIKLDIPKPEHKQKSNITEDKVQVKDSNYDQQQIEKQVLVKAVVSQTNRVNMMESDIDMQVKGQAVFIVHSQGTFLLDVLECKGQAKISYGETEQQLQKTRMKMLDFVSIADQRHAVKIEQSATTFVKIKSDHSIVRWIPVDYEAGLGLGYIQYAAGNLRYSAQFKTIYIEFQPIQQKKDFPSHVEGIQYTLFISNDTEKLDLGVKCETQSSGIQAIHLGAHPIDRYTQSEYIGYSIDKQTLQKRFQNTTDVYVNILARLVLRIPSVNASRYMDQQQEHYRFQYNRQQIPFTIYKQNQIESIPYHYLIGLVVAIGLLCILISYLFTRKIVPAVARLRTSNMIEQTDVQDGMEEVPASSDRNQRATESESGMN